MNDMNIIIENEYKGHSLRQEAQARRLVKAARVGQHRAPRAGRAIAIGHVVQIVLVMLGR